MPSAVVKVTPTVPSDPPVRTAEIVTLPPVSLTLYAAALRLTTPGAPLSRIVTVAVLGVPRTPPLGALRETVNVSFGSLTVSLRMATVNVLGALSPSAHVSVPLVAT